MNTPIMKVYEIFYFAPKDVKIDDVYIAESSIDAIKQFIIANKGKYNVFCASEVELFGGDWNMLNNQELESSSDYWDMVKLADYVTGWRE